jgi:hypothetical protein
MAYSNAVKGAGFVKVRLKGVEDVAAEFRDIAANQLPFANALALTMTALDSQGAIRSDLLPVRFTIRRRQWMERNIKIKRADKKDGRNVNAQIEDTFDAMALQEEGGEKLPGHGRRVLAVPLTGGARRSLSSVAAERDRPKAIMESGTGFIHWYGDYGVMYRRGMQYKRPKKYMKIKGPGAVMPGLARDKIVPMYLLLQQAPVKKRYGFEDKVRETVQARFDKNFEIAFAKAVKTATR